MLSLCISPAQAWELTGKVNRIEPTWIPEYVLFQLDTGIGGCTQATWIKYTGTDSGQTEPKKNVPAIALILLASLITRNDIAVYGTTPCFATNIQPMNQ